MQEIVGLHAALTLAVFGHRITGILALFSADLGRKLARGYIRYQLKKACRKSSQWPDSGIGAKDLRELNRRRLCQVAIATHVAYSRYPIAMVHNAFETDRQTLALLVEELRTMAHAARRRTPAGETLATTALVHEAYLKLARPSSARALDRQHFFALAARAMREILIDEARRRSTARSHALDQTLRELAAINPALAQVVNCRFFAGYSEVETAEIMAVDVRTVQRYWQRARAWLGELTPT
jgi:DNA-directed RNA polymerase specialized sigma24 family protein